MLDRIVFHVTVILFNLCVFFRKKFKKRGGPQEKNFKQRQNIEKKNEEKKKEKSSMWDSPWA